MKERKTRSLICVVTGRKLLATKDYYDRKVQKCGSEETLHKTYICKEAKTLLKNGYDVDSIRDMLNVDKKSLTDVSQEAIDQAMSNKTYMRRINNSNNYGSALTTKTDPDVKKFIERITSNER